jgi:CheY-like chemotaxis protein
MAEPASAPPRPILALVNDLFFTVKIQDTAKHLGLPIAFATSAQAFSDQLKHTRPALVIADLTLGGMDLAALLAPLTADAQQAAVPVLGYTTHADWKRTGPLHDKCTKVVTKDTLSHRLPALIRQLMRPDAPLRAEDLGGEGDRPPPP